LPDRTELEARLEEAAKSGDGQAAMDLIKQYDEMPESAGTQSPKEATNMSEINAANLGITEENAQAPVGEITKESLGIGGEFSSALNALDIATIKSYIADVQGTEDLSVLYMPGVTVLDPEHRFHVELRGDVRRAARGFAVFAAGGVSDDGVITSPNGNVHFVEGGVCFEKKETQQLDSLSGGISTIERTVPCKGHLEYRNTGTADKPIWKATGVELDRCLHQWALMFANGYYVSFSRNSYKDVVLTAIAERVGDEKAREVADAQITEWVENNQQRFETRKAFAQAINHTKDVMGLGEDEQLPPVADVLGYKFPDGRTLEEAILDLKGAIFFVTYTIPVNGEEVTQRIKAANTAEAKRRFAPAYALARTQGTQIKLNAIEAA
jgi:hypothetical protein